MPTGASTMAKRGLAGWLTRMLVASCALALAGCTSTGFGLSPAPDIGAAPVPQVQSQPLSGPTVGETVGTGPVRIGLDPAADSERRAERHRRLDAQWRATRASKNPA